MHFEQKLVFLSLAKGKASPAISHWAAVRSHCSCVSGFAISRICHSVDKAFFRLTTNNVKKQSILYLLKKIMACIYSCILCCTLLLCYLVVSEDAETNTLYFLFFNFKIDDLIQWH